MKKGEGHAEYFHKMQIKDPSYFYSRQLDNNDLFHEILWVNAESMVDYRNFDDVIYALT